MRFTASDPRLTAILDAVPSENIYLTRYGRIISDINGVASNDLVQIHFKLKGGKGGFGSLLRAIGSQIHRTTDRQSCR